MIVFVYDTLCCTAEEDDPINAVLYFHPGWVSDTQRHALAGQVSCFGLTSSLLYGKECLLDWFKKGKIIAALCTVIF